MKIYFTSSPRALYDLKKKKLLNLIFASLSDRGELISDIVIKNNPDEFYKKNSKEMNDFYQETINNIKKADIVVVETTLHSMAMGYLVNKSLELSKPTLCLYTEGNVPFFITGIDNFNLINLEYSIDSIEDVINEGFEYLSSKQDKRFNLMLPPEMLNKLTEISKKKHISKAQIIRDAIKNVVEKEF